MDLKELNCIFLNKHPWETARLTAIKRILNPYLFKTNNILDIGCGDGFVSRMLFGNVLNTEVTAVDVNITDLQIKQLSAVSNNIYYTKKIPDSVKFNILLLLDVIEHVEHEVDMITNIVKNNLSHGGKVLITVPAYQSLYSNHDKYLGHFRRYSLVSLEFVAKKAD
ncbi:MAG: methyltransferase domain-containing protein [Saprospiraceae bacterium]|nr:methyltransferase domain-containing protein [Candidatus Brachybacter algidus]